MRSRVRVISNKMSDNFFYDFLTDKGLSPVRVKELLTKADTKKAISTHDLEDLENFNSVLSKIVEKDRHVVSLGAKFLIYHKPTHSHGLIGFEMETWIIRMFNANIVLLKTATENIIEIVYEKCTKNEKDIVFINKEVVLLETEHDIEVEKGSILPEKKDRREFFRNSIKIEHYTWVICTVLTMILIALSYALTIRQPIDDIYKWLYDVVTKFIGPLAVTGTINYVNYHVSWRKVKKKTILWYNDKK
ncbi:hypothetical protein [Candidatus Magnetomonas plexicatena]|uniref:hypothetical protein n=1 Tax=Candidatus Magnetomonas plexicatena TaxID=2552947 RepID=UPI0011048616|nr:hypothetical protein E2O03_012805 [Nitrospirales bacterium LBB_01]